MELTKRQQDILYGMLLGDAYLQRTGNMNARLRLEHSFKQKEYIEWKYAELEHIFHSEPQALERIHPLSKRTYRYLRLQSYASSELGQIRTQFYSNDGKKQLPLKIEDMLASPLTVAIWYMDDGHYDKRDKSAHIYLQAFHSNDIQRLIDAFGQLGIECKAYCRPDRNACQLNFRNVGKNKLFELITPHLISTMRYKTPFDPVTTDLKPVQVLVR